MVIRRIICTLVIMCFICLIGYHVFLPLYQSNHIIIDYGITPFDICIEQPVIWKFCKYWFVFTFIFTSFFISNMFINLFKKHFLKFSEKEINKNLKSKKIEKKKVSYSLIEPKPPNSKLELLIR